MFYVGQKVVCVKRGEWTNQRECPQWPVYGEVYTIREISGGFDDLFLKFEEVYSPMEGGGEFRWWAHRFRPLQEQGMSMLRAILVDPKKELEAA